MTSDSLMFGVEPVLPDASMHLVSPTEPVTGRVVSTTLCTRGGTKSAAFVRHVAIDVGDTPLAGNFLVGQSFGVLAPGVDARGKPHKVRLYSIASPSYGEDGQGNVLSTTPKRVIEERTPQRKGDDPEDHSLFLGVCSNYVCDLRVGDEVRVSGPNGKRFLLPTDVNAHNFLFLATGTGIAPFRGMIMELLDGHTEPCRNDVHLVMGSPYTTDLMYDDMFRAYAEQHGNFHYHTAVSREPRPDGSRGVYVDGHVTEQLDTFRPLLEDPRTLIYVCGLAGMQAGIFKMLAENGLGRGYLKVAEEIADIEPSNWTWDQLKRYVRPTRRCMLEVY